MTWPAPRRSSALAYVEPSTYGWGYVAYCPCHLDFSPQGGLDYARSCAHEFALRCPIAQRRLTHYRRDQREAAR